MQHTTVLLHYESYSKSVTEYFNHNFLQTIKTDKHIKHIVSEFPTFFLICVKFYVLECMSIIIKQTLKNENSSNHFFTIEPNLQILQLWRLIKRDT